MGVFGGADYELVEFCQNQSNGIDQWIIDSVSFSFQNRSLEGSDCCFACLKAGVRGQTKKKSIFWGFVRKHEKLKRIVTFYHSILLMELYPMI